MRPWNPRAAQPADRPRKARCRHQHQAWSIPPTDQPILTAHNDGQWLVHLHDRIAMEPAGCTSQNHGASKRSSEGARAFQQANAGPQLGRIWAARDVRWHQLTRTVERINALVRLQFSRCGQVTKVGQNGFQDRRLRPLGHPSVALNPLVPETGKDLDPDRSMTFGPLLGCT